MKEKILYVSKYALELTTHIVLAFNHCVGPLYCSTVEFVGVMDAHDWVVHHTSLKSIHKKIQISKLDDVTGHLLSNAWA